MNARSTLLLAGALLSGLLVSGRAAPPVADTGTPEQIFAAASQAYDEDRMEDAIEGYERLLQAGTGSIEVYYNLGNSWFRAGELGQAVLRYRQGWHLAPRDNALNANLTYALEMADALGPDALLLERLLFKLAQSEWVIVGTAAWITAALVVFLMIIDRRRWLYTRLFWVCLAMLLLSLAGIGVWALRLYTPETVVIESGQSALFAPLASSPPHFDIPEGSIARRTSVNGEWVEIRVGGKTGWLPRTAVENVYPCRAE